MKPLRTNAWAVAVLSMIGGCGEPAVRGGPAEPRASGCEVLAIVPQPKTPHCDGAGLAERTLFPGLIDIQRGVVYLAETPALGRGEAIDLASGRTKFRFEGQIVAADCESLYIVNNRALVAMSADSGASRIVRTEMIAPLDGGRVEGRQLVVGVDGWPEHSSGIGDVIRAKPAKAWRIDIDDGDLHEAPIAGFHAPRSAPFTSRTLRFEMEDALPATASNSNPTELRAIDAGKVLWSRVWEPPILVCRGVP